MACATSFPLVSKSAGVNSAEECCFGSASPVELRLKNTFLEFCFENEDVKGAVVEKRSSSVPPCSRLCLSEGEPQQELKSDSGCDVSTDLGDSASTIGSEPSEQDQQPPTPRPRTRLSTKARPWAGPTDAVCPAVPVPPASSKWDHHFWGVISCAQAGLQCCEHVSRVAIQTGSAGYSITVHMHPQLFHRKELVLTYVKQALMDAAEESECIYVLGFRAKPFTPTPMGFVAKLGVVEDWHSMCSGYVEKNWCHFGNQCRWKHTACEKAVGVMVVPDETVMAPVVWC